MYAATPRRVTLHQVWAAIDFLPPAWGARKLGLARKTHRVVPSATIVARKFQEVSSNRWFRDVHRYPTFKRTDHHSRWRMVRTSDIQNMLSAIETQLDIKRSAPVHIGQEVRTLGANVARRYNGFRNKHVLVTVNFFNDICECRQSHVATTLGHEGRQQ